MTPKSFRRTGPVVLFVFQFFTVMFLANKFMYDEPTDSRRGESENPQRKIEEPIILDAGGSNGEPNLILYSDSFNGANDTSSLKSRGYKVYYRGTGPQGLTAAWFQGSSIVFHALNGTSTGYVAANFNAVTSQNNIDNWLVLPKKSVLTGDSVFFFSRSIFESRFPDSIRVMFSQAGDSVPEAAWTEIGRMKVNTLGAWEKRGFRAPSSGTGARFAIRYNVVNGGPSGVNSDYIGIDSLTIERAIIYPNNMKSVSISSPEDLVGVNGIPIAPMARFTNIGSNSLSNISVRFVITGPVNYTSNKVITFLNAGDSATVKFDSTFVPVAGSYTAKAISILAQDTNRNNDTVSKSFTASQIDFGSSNGIFFSSSFAIGAPSNPQFCWKDTSGSITLINDGEVALPEIFTGTTDNGYFSLGNLLPPGRRIILGDVYDSVYVTTNGVVAMSRAGSDILDSTPDSTNVIKNSYMPLWMDLSFSGIPQPPNRLSYKVIGSSLVLITYSRASIKNGGSTDYVSFQVIIDLLDYFSGTDSRVVFQISDTTGGRTGNGFISKYYSTTLPAHVTGVSKTQMQKCLYRYAGLGFVTIPGSIFRPTPVTLQFGPDGNRLLYSCSPATLQLQASLEALTPDSPPSSNSSDTIGIELRELSYPFEPVDYSRKVLSNSGNATMNYANIRPGRSYYIVTHHRNSIETWSATGLLIPSAGANVSYNFTTGVNKAYGNNMVLTGGTASIYTGDVNQDFSVDGSDLSPIDNDAFVFASGYLSTDINNDGIVDGTDAQFTDNNASNFIFAQRP